MGTATVANIEGKDFSELPKETKTNSEDTNKVSNTNKNKNTASDGRGKKSRRRHKKMTTTPPAAVIVPVQRLFDTCKDVFSLSGTGIVPSPDKIQKLKAVLDEIQPADVGLSPKMPFFSPPVTQQAPPITYLHIYENDKFSMGIFCLPPSGVLPLHNHPGMTVFSKLLFGTMHIKSYDWAFDIPGNASAAADPSQSQAAQHPALLAKVKVDSAQHPEAGLAKVKVDSDFTAPCNTSILYPADGGNMHCFTAVTACAVLDVLGPPYSDPKGRHCTYYFDHPFPKFSADGVTIPEEEKDKYAWLQEREKPEDLAVVGGLYTGPEIVEN